MTYKKRIKTRKVFDLRAVKGEEGLRGIVKAEVDKNTAQIKDICAFFDITKEKEISVDIEHMFFYGGIRDLIYNGSHFSKEELEGFIDKATYQPSKITRWNIPLEKMGFSDQQKGLVIGITRDAERKIKKLMAQATKIEIDYNNPNYMNSLGGRFTNFPTTLKQYAHDKGVYYIAKKIIEV